MKKGPVSQLEVAWNTLISIASEQAAAMVNSSFSAVLGEMEDLSAPLRESEPHRDADPPFRFETWDRRRQ